jgi:hypothetical protein
VPEVLDRCQKEQHVHRYVSRHLSENVVAILPVSSPSHKIYAVNESIAAPHDESINQMPLKKIYTNNINNTFIY